MLRKLRLRQKNGFLIRDSQQITFITLNRFCPLSKKTPTPSVLNRQYQVGWNTKQNEMKNSCLFYSVFQVLKVLLKVQPVLSFICFTSAFTSADIIFYNF